jgi:hypothetical protein
VSVELATLIATAIGVAVAGIVGLHRLRSQRRAGALADVFADSDYSGATVTLHNDGPARARNVAVTDIELGPRSNPQAKAILLKQWAGTGDMPAGGRIVLRVMLKETVGDSLDVKIEWEDGGGRQQRVDRARVVLRSGGCDPADQEPVRVPGGGKHAEAWAIRDRERVESARSGAFVVRERYHRRETLFARLRSMKYTFMATFGEEAGKPFAEIDRIINEIFVASQMLGTHYWPRQGREPMTEEERKKQLEEMHSQEAIFWITTERLI